MTIMEFREKYLLWLNLEVLNPIGVSLLIDNDGKTTIIDGRDKPGGLIMREFSDEILKIMMRVEDDISDFAENSHTFRQHAFGGMLQTRKIELKS